MFLLGKTIPLLPNADGELRAANGDQPADPVGVERYLVKAFGDHLAEVRTAMEELAARYEPAELNRIGFRCMRHSGLRSRRTTKGGARRRNWMSGRSWRRHEVIRRDIELILALL